MSEQVTLIKKYFRLLDSFATDPEAYADVWHPDMLQTEYPNLVAPKGQERGIEGCLKGLESGKKLLGEQKIEIRNHFESGNQVVVEGVWTGKVAVSAPPLKKGQEIRASLCMIFEFREGKIYRQRNYDCYEPIK